MWWLYRCSLWAVHVASEFLMCRLISAWNGEEHLLGLPAGFILFMDWVWVLMFYLLQFMQIGGLVFIFDARIVVCRASRWPIAVYLLLQKDVKLATSSSQLTSRGVDLNDKWELKSISIQNWNRNDIEQRKWMATGSVLRHLKLEAAEWMN